MLYEEEMAGKTLKWLHPSAMVEVQNHLESRRLKALSASLRREQTMRVQAGAKTRHKVALAQTNIASTK